jgi:hypothetical protein
MGTLFLQDRDLQRVNSFLLDITDFQKNIPQVRAEVC